MHEEALAIRRKKLGNEHPVTAQSLNNLAELLGAHVGLNAHVDKRQFFNLTTSGNSTRLSHCMKRHLKVIPRYTGMSTPLLRQVSTT